MIRSVRHQNQEDFKIKTEWDKREGMAGIMSKFGNTMFDSLKGSNIMNKSK